MTVNVVLLFLLLFAGLWTVMTGSLLRSAIGLAFTSAILSMLMFQLGAPLAGVFELSVCAGLITVVFVSAISMTKPLSEAEQEDQDTKRVKRYALLPVLLALAAWGMSSAKGLVASHFRFPAAVATAEDVGQVFWNIRRFDLMGQIIIILVGIFGVVVLFKARGRVEGGKQ